MLVTILLWLIIGFISTLAFLLVSDDERVCGPMSFVLGSVFGLLTTAALVWRLVLMLKADYRQAGRN